MSAYEQRVEAPDKKYQVTMLLVLLLPVLLSLVKC